VRVWVWPLLLALPVAALLLGATPWGRGTGPGSRVLMLAFPGMSWSVAEDLIESGEMPNLARLRATGAWGDLEGVPPFLSQATWTTIASGKTSDDHQVLGLHATAHDVRVRRVWQIYADRGWQADDGMMYQVMEACRDLGIVVCVHAENDSLIEVSAAAPPPTPVVVVEDSEEVEEDIDPSNLEQVLWAMSTRALLDRSIQILPYCAASNVHTAIPLSEKRSTGKRKPLTAARVVIDACRDLSWKEDWYPIARISPELRTTIIEKWTSVLSALI